jgi:hypothetical protein
MLFFIVGVGVGVGVGLGVGVGVVGGCYLLFDVFSLFLFDLNWTSIQANQICGIEPSFSAFNCTTSVSPSGEFFFNNIFLPHHVNFPGDVYELMACIGAYGSCYQNTATSENCCGCVNWNTQGIYVPPSTRTCVAQNPNWIADVLPDLQFLKAATPTVCTDDPLSGIKTHFLHLDTYPCDDPSSSLQCSLANSNGNNQLDYTINFCPESKPNIPNTSSSTAGSTSQSNSNTATAGDSTGTTTNKHDLTSSAASQAVSMVALIICLFFSTVNY